MSEDHEAEIRASVAAHRDLGSGYDAAVAEGLVERIGAEIDKRIDARIGSGAATQYAQQPYGPPVFGPVGYGPPARPPVVPPTVPPGPPQRQAQVQHATSPLIVLGSMGFGVIATGIVTGKSGPATAHVFMVALIWIAIAVINFVYAHRR